MDYDYLEKEVLEISSFLQIIVHLDSKELDALDLLCLQAKPIICIVT